MDIGGLGIGLQVGRARRRVADAGLRPEVRPRRFEQGAGLGQARLGRCHVGIATHGAADKIVEHRVLEDQPPGAGPLDGRGRAFDGDAFEGGRRSGQGGFLNRCRGTRRQQHRGQGESEDADH